MAKQFSACNWVPSKITATQINGYVTTGALASKRVLHWRVPDSECPPEPQDGEVIVLMQHLDRIQSPRIKILPGCPRKLPTPSTRYWTELRVQYMQLSSILRSLPSRRTICGVVPGFFSFEPPNGILGWSRHRAWWRFNSVKERS